jgi:hypothetical protein
MNIVESILFYAAGIVFLLAGAIKLLRAARRPQLPPLHEIHREIREQAKDDVREIERTHDSVFDGDRISVADRVIADLDRIRREREQRKK